MGQSSAKLVSTLAHTAVVTQRYIERIGLMANAMMKGQLVIYDHFGAIGVAAHTTWIWRLLFSYLFIPFTVLNMIRSAVARDVCGDLPAFTGQFWPGPVVLLLYLTCQ